MEYGNIIKHPKWKQIEVSTVSIHLILEYMCFSVFIFLLCCLFSFFFLLLFGYVILLYRFSYEFSINWLFLFSLFFYSHFFFIVVYKKKSNKIERQTSLHVRVLTRLTLIVPWVARGQSLQKNLRQNAHGPFLFDDKHTDPTQPAVKEK